MSWKLRLEPDTNGSLTGAAGREPGRTGTLHADLIGPDGMAHSAPLSALFARASQASERIIVPINASALEIPGSRPAFYCIHSLSGAGGTDFLDLAQRVPEVRFYGIQAPAAKMADPDFGNSVPSIADQYASALVAFQPDGSFFLSGWSAGAIIALEIAQNLRARGRDVALLVAIDAAPHNTVAALRPWHPIYLKELVRNVPGWLAGDIPRRKQDVRPLARRILKKTVAFAKMSLAVGADKSIIDGYVVEGFTDLSRYPDSQQAFMKRLYRALMDYVPAPYRGDVVAYEARIKPLFHLPQVGRVWREIAPRSIVVAVKGNHLSIIRKRHVDGLAEDLRSRIAHAISDPAFLATRGDGRAT